MKIDFSLTLEDYQAYLRHVEAEQAQRRRGHRVRLALFLLATAVAMVLILLWTNHWTIKWEDPFTAVVAGLVGLQCIAAFFEVFSKRTAIGAIPKLYEAERARGQTEGLSCELTPDRVVYTTRHSSISLGWSMILHIGHTEDHLFLMNGETTGFVIPRRAFPTEHQFQAFAEKAKEYHASHGNH